MKELLPTFRSHLEHIKPFLNSLLRRRELTISSVSPVTASPDPKFSEYLANIYMAPGELTEQSLFEPRRSAIIEFARQTGKDIIHLPSKPQGRVLIGVGLAAMAIVGAVKIYEHNLRKD